MQFMEAALFLFLVATAIEVVHGQSIHVVNVGNTGSFYDPPTVSALKGDIVTFRFSGAMHTVVQSSFAAPCTSLPGGFDSGISGLPAQTIAPIPEWNLTVMDDTQPIWFHCKFTMPVPHCTSGMVGAINAVTAGTNQSYELFVQAAKSLTSVPPVTGTAAILTGVGAFATAAPMPRNGTNITASSAPANLTSTSTTAIPTTSSSDAATTPTQSPAQAPSASKTLSTTQKGGIAGGIAGGALVVILLILLCISYRRGQRLRKEAAVQETLHFNTGRNMSHPGRSKVLYVGPEPEPSPTTPAHVDRLHRSPASRSVAESLEKEGTTPSVSMKELAAEVATLMRQEMRSGDAGRTRQAQAQDAGGLAAVPESPFVATNSNTELMRAASTRAESARTVSARTESARAESTRTARQLPRPPPKRTEDTYSVDTLPEYVIGQSR